MKRFWGCTSRLTDSRAAAGSRSVDLPASRGYGPREPLEAALQGCRTCGYGKRHVFLARRPERCWGPTRLP